MRIAGGRFARAVEAAAGEPANADLLAALKERRIDPEEAAGRLVEAVAREIAAAAEPPDP